jgi:thiopurine S-methyltransferase
MDSRSPEFWNERYQSGRMAWDAGGVPQRFTEFINRQEPRGNALVPGCGSAYEVKALTNTGWTVHAIDFSPPAIERASEILGNCPAHLECGDFFESRFPYPFDLIYERTFLCSLRPSLWESYVNQVFNLLGPGGLLAGFFYYGEEPEPPPFPLTQEGADSLFAARFQLVEDVAIPNAESLPLYAGAERWQVWQKSP